VKLYLFLLLLIPGIFSCSESVRKEPMVVATNSWTAAFATCAGAKNVMILAPMEMAHPAEYELRASDIPVLVHAKIVVYAGYETMVQRLKSGMELKSEALVKIETDYSMPAIEKSVLKIAKILGTEKIAIQNLDSIRHLLLAGRALCDKTNSNSAPILVNFFQQSIVREMGFQIAGVFGPAALEAGDIDKMMKLAPSVVIDNVHNPVGKPLLQSNPEVKYRQLLNFPGFHQTTTLQEVIQYNILQLSSLKEKNNQ
jgi:zinc transport system substrate-binding protein